MLQVVIELVPERYDEKNHSFIDPVTKTLQLEHSLVSISKWESKWCKSFIGSREKTDEEVLDYIKCMTITQNVDPKLYNYLSRENIRQINNYIDAPMTATHFREDPNAKPNRDTITSELIYYWMITFGIPFECQKWHLNRLLTLIHVCIVKNQPAKKMSRGETARQNAALNAARRKRLNTRG